MTLFRISLRATENIPMKAEKKNPITGRIYTLLARRVMYFTGQIEGDINIGEPVEGMPLEAVLITKNGSEIPLILTTMEMMIND